MSFRHRFVSSHFLYLTYFTCANCGSSPCKTLNSIAVVGEVDIDNIQQAVRSLVQLSVLVLKISLMSATAPSTSKENPFRKKMLFTRPRTLLMSIRMGTICDRGKVSHSIARPATQGPQWDAPFPSEPSKLIRLGNCGSRQYKIMNRLVVVGEVFSNDIQKTVSDLAQLAALFIVALAVFEYKSDVTDSAEDVERIRIGEVVAIVKAASYGFDFHKGGNDLRHKQGSKEATAWNARRRISL